MGTTGLSSSTAYRSVLCELLAVVSAAVTSLSPCLVVSTGLSSSTAYRSVLSELLATVSAAVTSLSPCLGDRVQVGVLS